MGDILEHDKNELYPIMHARFRANVARAMYLAQDRTDIMYAVKELARRTPTPNEGDWNKLKKLARYVVGKIRVVVRFDRQEWDSRIIAWTDTDYAGCLRARKSTSGGVIRIGKHIIRGWSNTQGVIALSSGEAEFYGIVKGAAMAMGMRAIIADMGINMSIEIKQDASAARSIAMRKGIGKVRHIEVNQLWIQENVANVDIQISKVEGEENLADALTQYVHAEKIKNHMECTGHVKTEGRRIIMPSVARDDSDITDEKLTEDVEDVEDESA
jgi:hypothetical protein